MLLPPTATSRMSSFVFFFQAEDGIRDVDLGGRRIIRSEEHTSELQSRLHLVCRLLLEKKNNNEEASMTYAILHLCLLARTIGGIFYLLHTKVIAGDCFVLSG